MLSGILNGWLTSTSLHKGSHPPHPPNKYVEWFINLHFLHKGSNPTPPLNKYVESFMSCHLSSWGIKSPSPSELQLPSGTVKRRVCWVHVFPCKTKQSIRGDRFLQYCFEPEKQIMNSPIAELWHRMYLLEKQALPSEFGATHFNGTVILLLSFTIKLTFKKDGYTGCKSICSSTWGQNWKFQAKTKEVASKSQHQVDNLPSNSHGMV